jgi:uncharacterized protein (DUF4415 family)
MAGKQVDGVAGVLAGLVGRTEERSEPSPAPSSRELKSQEARHKPRREKSHSAPAVRHARRGRPPGKASGKSPPKEKVTLRVRAALLAEYRDWSWEKRCQLGELVEQALAEYRRKRRRDD